MGRLADDDDDNDEQRNKSTKTLIWFSSVSFEFVIMAVIMIVSIPSMITK